MLAVDNRIALAVSSTGSSASCSYVGVGSSRWVVLPPMTGSVKGSIRYCSLDGSWSHDSGVFVSSSRLVSCCVLEGPAIPRPTSGWFAMASASAFSSRRCFSALLSSLRCTLLAPTFETSPFAADLGPSGPLDYQHPNHQPAH